MKLLFAASVSAIVVATSGVAGLPVSVGASAVVEHSGGCRKDSPRGQCCHAGSQPYHCH